MNLQELIQSQQPPQAPNARKKKPTIRLTTRVTMLLCPNPPPPPPPQAPFCTGSWSWMKSCARHTKPGTISVDDNQLKCFCDQSVQLKHLRLVNLTENDAQLTFKAPCYVALECGLAMDLLF